MDKERFRECLRALHWPSATVAEVLNVPPSTSIGWMLGSDEVPPQVALWLETLARVHLEAPIPTIEAATQEQKDASEADEREVQLSDPQHGGTQD